MKSPPAVAGDNISVKEALHRMMAEKISSIFIVSNHRDGEGDGILTERDILRAIDDLAADVLSQPASRFATRPLVSLDQDEFVYRAVRQMAASGFRHLGIEDADGALVGAVSARDLLKQRAGGAITLGDNIAEARSAAELGKVWGGLAAVAETLVSEEIDARDIAEIISLELQALTRRACEIAEREFLESGKGEPPSPYAMLVLGSGGRGESLLAMDQDNAIIYREGEPGSVTDTWFKALGERVAAILNEAGVAFCQGGVMASNAAWRMDAVHWRKRVAEWLKVNSPDNILSADIFFDGHAVHGDLDLGEALMQDALQAAGQSPAFLSTLSRHAADFESPVGWFGRIKLKEGRVDLKKGGLMALFSTARVLALKFGISARSTRARFLASREHLDHGEEAVGNLVEAHRIILETILRQQLRDLTSGIQLSNSIRPSELNGFQRENLRWALDKIPLTADLLGTPPRL
jgi:DNA polymerase-3 subunit epsilon/CBS domain-containing protein